MEEARLRPAAAAATAAATVVHADSKTTHTTPSSPSSSSSSLHVHPSSHTPPAMSTSAPPPAPAGSPPPAPSQLTAVARQLLAGTASGVALVLAGHPFDTVKVRMQSEGMKGRFKGPIDCLMQTVRAEGVLALYKGAAVPMLMTGVVNSVMFTLMDRCKRWKVHRREERERRQPEQALHHQRHPVTTASAPSLSTPAHVSTGSAAVANAAATSSTQPGKPTTAEVMACGSQTGVVLAFLVTPMELIKAKLQVQYASGSQRLYRGPVDVIRHQFQERGLRGLYRGLPLTMAHRGSNWAYFGGYEIARRWLTGGQGAGDGTLSPVATVLAGGFAGTCFWLSMFPVDVVKNRLQAAPYAKHPNTWHTVQTIYSESGVRGFFRGFTPCLLRSLPANAAAFTAYEVTLRLLPF